MLAIAACLMAGNLYATYYITGNGSGRESWCNGQDWSPNNAGCVLTNGEITYTNLPAEWYEFKITDGTWSNELNYNDLDMAVSSPMYKTYGDNTNICFRLHEPTDVTIKVVDGKVQLLIDRTYIITGNGDPGTKGAWCAGHSWWASDTDDNAILDENFSISYSALPAGSYEFKVKDNVSGDWQTDNTFTYDNLDTDYSSPGYYSGGGDGKNICFSLSAAADVTIAIVNNKVRLTIAREFSVTGNGETQGAPWCAGKNWWAKNDAAKLDADLNITFANMPAKDGYKFRVKENIDSWPSSTVFGYDRCDTENSYTCTTDNDNNICFDLSLPKDVHISLGHDNKVRFTATPIYFIVGTMTSWATANTDYRIDDSKTLSSLAAGEHKLRICNGKWSPNGGTVWDYDNLDIANSSFGTYSSGNDKNIAFTLGATADVTVEYDPASGTITLTTPSGYFASSTYNITGESSLTGYNWSNNAADAEMTDNGDGSYELVVADKYLSAGTYQYKVIANHKWDAGCTYPVGNGNNATVSIPAAGVYTLTYTFTPATKTLVCEAVRQTQEVTISAYGYSTFFFDKAYEVPENVGAYIFTGVQDEKLVQQQISIIPANTGVLLQGAAGEAFSFGETTTDVTYDANLFTGTLTDTEINNGNVHYILGVSSGVCGLYWPYGAENGVGAFTNAAHKAYLEFAPAAAPKRIRGFALDGSNVVTAVSAIPTDEDGAYYDILGRQVTSPQKGNIYIHNGKKVMY